MSNRKQSQSWEDLGKTIEDIIDHAVTCRDYELLSQTINKVIDSAADSIGRSVEFRKNKTHTVKTTYHVESSRNPSYPVTSENLPVLYSDPNKKNVGGILQVVGGSIMTGCTGLSLLGTAITGAITGSAIFTYASAVLAGAVGGSLYLLFHGIHSLGRSNRFQKYVSYLGKKTYGSIDALSKHVHKPQKFVKKELQRLIDKGYFLEGHIDTTSNTLITSNETFKHYQQSLIAQQQQKAAEEEKKKSAKVSSDIQNVLNAGHAYLAEIRTCNDEIPGEIISKKISTMESVVERIFVRAEAHPETIPTLKKLMDYYLPMTVKLLHAYAEMDHQDLQGDTILASKAEIEKTIDTLNSAFAKLLDSMFVETALDVSSDISVLNTLLAQEGLTDDELSQIKKDNTFE